MSDTPTTALSLAYTHEDGSTQALGTGSIDLDGRIVVDAPAEGQGDYLAPLVEEINARADVVIKGRPSGGIENRYAMVKERIDRGAPEFLGALQTYVARIYGITLEFDAAAITPPERGSQVANLAGRVVETLPPDEELAELEAALDADEPDEADVEEDTDNVLIPTEDDVV